MHRLRYLETGEKQQLDLDGNIIRTLGRKQRLPKSQGDKARLVLSAPERVAIVHEIFRMYTQRGMGFKAIANELNGRWIPSPKNGTWSEGTHGGWSQSTVRSLLFNPVYTGDMVWNRRTGGKFHRIAGEQAVARENSGYRGLVSNDKQDHVIVSDTHPAIIDRETWSEVERLRAAKETRGFGSAFRGGRAKASRYVLSGLIRCSHCGQNYVGQTINKGKPRKDGSRVRTRYYTCAGYLSRGRNTCRKTPIPAEAMEAMIWERIGTQVTAFLNNGGTDLLREALSDALKV
jgi:site-specific DNA recombinase